MYINKNKGRLTLKLENDLSIKDKISINNNLYNVSELMKENKNYENLDKGSIVQIGRMKGNINIGDKIYKIESYKLTKLISPTFNEEKNYKKIPLNGKIIIKNNTPISLKVWATSCFYNGLEYCVTSSITPSIAQTKSTTHDEIYKQISKTGNTEFYFTNLEIDLEDNLFVQISLLNDLRRTAILGLENLVMKKFTHNLKKSYKINISENSNINNYNSLNNTNYIESNINISNYNNCIDANNSSLNVNNSNIINFNNKDNCNDTNIKTSLLLNVINSDFNYLSLKNVDRIYIPLRFFINNSYENILKDISKKFSTYIYMPTILKDSMHQDFNEIISKFNIKGAVISHISQIDILSKYKLNLIGNFTLNIFNNFSIDKLKDLNLSEYTISPELNRNEIANLTTRTNLL